MAFQQLSTLAHIAKFNSATSSDFLSDYEKFVDDAILTDLQEPSSRYIAPSGIRCLRAQWFRLRGTSPDSQFRADRTLNFYAELGTAIHRIVQTNIKTLLGADWLSVSDYLNNAELKHKFKISETDTDSLETRVEVIDIPIRFACDGIIRYRGKLYLIEIKTIDYSSFQELTNIRSVHIPQIKCYASLLKLHNVLVIYVDRTHGDMKIYELNVSDTDMDDVDKSLKTIVECAEYNIAPDRLPRDDPWCSSSRCKFYKVCKEWG